jgi:glutaminyl-tRNA synthetase
MAVLRPLKLILDNFPEDQVQEVEARNHPEDPEAGSRTLPLTRELYIEQEDFREEAPRKYHRLVPGREVRLRYACIVKCVGFDRDPGSGEITAVHCTWDPESLGGQAPDGRKIKGTIHWVSAPRSAPAEVRLYDPLFHKADPEDVEEGQDFLANLNPASLEQLRDCRVEQHLQDLEPGATFQFERLGYFCADRKDCRPGALVFNRTATLRDTWAKIEKKQK